MTGIFNKNRRSIVFGASVLAGFTSSGATIPSSISTGRQQFFNPTNGHPLAGALLYTYAAGTSTLLTTYQDATHTVRNSNPITLDSTGGALIYSKDSYKIVLTDLNGNIVNTIDNFNSDLAAELRENLAKKTGSSLVGWVRNSVGAVSRWVQDKLRESDLSIEDFGGSVEAPPLINDAAIKAAFSAGNVVFLPFSGYQFSQTITIPVGKTLKGRGQQATLISMTKPVVAVRLTGQYATLKGIGISGFGAVNAIEVGDFVNNAGRVTVDDVQVANAGNDSLQIRNGNLGVIRNFTSLNPVRDGINFTAELPDTNAWTLEGFIDLRGGRDGLHLESGGSVGDPNAPRSNSACLITAQGQSRYGVYVGTRSNLIRAYCEAFGSAGVYLDANAAGNEIVTVEGGVTDASRTPMSNIVYNANANASYWRVFQNKTQFSGGANRGLRVSNSDGQPGYFDIEKTAASEQRFRYQGSRDTWTVIWENTASGQILLGKFGGWFEPSVDNAYRLGDAAARWSTVYAGTATINTSDEREKEQVQSIDAAALRAWSKVNYCQFKFKDAVETKGDGARWHFGVIAQRVKEAFESEGLDPFEYGVLCYDEWQDQYEPVHGERVISGPDGKEFIETYDTGEKRLGISAGSRYGIRYDEALVLECAYLRSRLTTATLDSTTSASIVVQQDFRGCERR